MVRKHRVTCNDHTTIREYLYGTGATKRFAVQYLFGMTGSELADECSDYWLDSCCTVETDEHGLDTVKLHHGETFDGSHAICRELTPGEHEMYTFPRASRPANSEMY